MTEKVFRNTRTQIGILTSRGVIIKNKSKAKKIINETNYYNLINGYKTPFIMYSTPYEKYLHGTKFEEIYALYEFDRQLRLLTLEYILKIEKHIKSLIAHYFSKKYTHKNYLVYKNFDVSNLRKYKQVSDLLGKLHNKICYNIDKDASIKHYADGANDIPLWVLVNAISMGDTSKFYVNMKQKDKNNIAKMFKWGVYEDELSNALHFIASIRNRCAHDELLYAYTSHVELEDNNYFKYFHIHNRTNYFAMLIALKILLSKNEFQIFVRKLDNLFLDLEKHLATISISKIKTLMGFPKRWKKLINL